MINPFDMPVVYSPKIEDVLYWVYERDMIRIRKEAKLEAPYTEDPILNKYRFCNIRRRHDKVTHWLIENIYWPYKQAGGRDLWFIAAISRYINWPPTMSKLLDGGVLPKVAERFEPEPFVELLEEMKSRNEKIFTGAYMIFAGHTKGISKVETVGSKFLYPLSRRAPELRKAVALNSVEGLVSELTNHYGWSTFIAGQVVSDLTYFDDELGKATDLYHWAPMGPGSMRGLNRLFGRPLKSRWKAAEFNSALRSVWKEIAEQLDLKDITLHDVQNVMCEMDKYWRVLNGEGRPRALYKPETAY